MYMNVYIFDGSRSSTFMSDGECMDITCMMTHDI